MPNPKFTLLTLDYPPERGGVARYLGNLVAASGGHFNVVVEREHDRSGPGTVMTRELFWKYWPHWWPMVDVCREQAFRQTTIFVSHVFPVGTATWISRLLGGPEYVVLFHGTDVRRARSLWKKWLLRRICASAKLLMTNSEVTKQELNGLIGKRDVLVLTPAVEDRQLLSRDAARRALHIDVAKKVVVTIARFVPRKGIDQAIRAIGELQKTIGVEYVVIGNGLDLGRLEVVEVDAKATVRWLLEATDEEKWTWLSAADVFLLPGRDEGQDVEGFGIAYLEAAKVGVPSIAGKSGGSGEAVIDQETGLLVEPRSTNDILRALKMLLEHDEMRHRLGERAKARVEKEFRWDERWEALARAMDPRT